MNFPNRLQAVRGTFLNVFIRYGSGAEILRPLAKTKWWNAASWVLIAVGIVGWAAFIFWPY